MEFNNHKTIYLQIADYICEKILMRKWATGDRIPSVRELGVALEVNPNTVVRAYEYLETAGIIVNKRGVGFFLTDDTLVKTKTLQKEIFVAESLPAMFKSMYLLQISMDDLQKQYDKFCKNYSKINAD